MIEIDGKFVELQVLDALTERGFVRYRKFWVDKLIYPGFHCWIGLPLETRKGHIEVHPHVGIHSEEIEKMLASMSDPDEKIKYSRSNATYALWLAAIENLPPTQRFIFSKEYSLEMIQLEARRLAELCFTFGLNYAKSIANYDSLVQLLKECMGIYGGYPERAAIALLLAGRKEEGVALIKEFSKERPSMFEYFICKLEAAKV